MLVGASFSLMSFTDASGSYSLSPNKTDSLVYFTGGTPPWEIYDDGCNATTWVYSDGNVVNEEGPC